MRRCFSGIAKNRTARDPVGRRGGCLRRGLYHLEAPVGLFYLTGWFIARRCRGSVPASSGVAPRYTPVLTRIAPGRIRRWLVHIDAANLTEIMLRRMGAPGGRASDALRLCVP